MSRLFQRASRAPVASMFNPADLFIGGHVGAWYDFTDIGSLWQDTARTTPVTASGQTVAGVTDKSGTGRHLAQATSGARPLFTISGSLSYLTFDGVDDHFTVTSAVGTSWTAALCYRKSSAALRAIGFGGTGSSAHISIGDNTGSRIVGAPYNLTAGAGITLQGPAASGGKTTFGVASAVNNTQTSGELYYNKVGLSTSNLSSGLTLPSTWTVFGRAATGYFSGDCVGFLDINRVLTQAERNAYETWVCDKAGVSI